MILKMFTVYDSKAEAFIQPFYEQATGAAIRSFESAANSVEHNFHKYGGDYTLFEIGTFNPQTGEITVLPSMINLGLAITFTDALAGAIGRDVTDSLKVAEILRTESK